MSVPHRKLKPLPADEVGRKLLHLVAIVLPLLVLETGRQALWVLVPLAAVAFGADVLRAHWPPFQAWIRRTFGRLMRESEFIGRMPLNGSTWVCISMAGLVAVFPADIAALSMTVHLVGDVCSALVGQSVGRTVWPGTTRTVEGSLAYLVVGMIVMVAWPGMVLWSGLIAVVLAAAAEIPRGPFNDNLRVPAVIALVLVLLEGATF